MHALFSCATFRFFFLGYRQITNLCLYKGLENYFEFFFFSCVFSINIGVLSLIGGRPNPLTLIKSRVKLIIIIALPEIPFYTVDHIVHFLVE